VTCFACNGTGEICDQCGVAENACQCDTSDRDLGNPQTFSACEACGGTGKASPSGEGAAKGGRE
jgi:hypothetical protein